MPATIGFSTGPPPKPPGKGAGIGSAIGAIVGAVTGSGCGTGAGGFQKGNRCGSKSNRNDAVAAASKAHTKARAKAMGYLRRGTALSEKGKRAVAEAAAAHEALGVARKAHESSKVAARRAKAQAAKAVRSTEAVHNLLAGHAADKIADLRSKAQSGDHQIVDTLAGLHRAVRATNKAELFTAAKLLGIKHTATTKGGLTDHIAAHLISGGKAKPNQHAHDPSEHTDHAPGHVGYLKTSLIHVDPDRFQYKIGSASKTGSVGSLDGTTRFDHDLSGIVQVWRDPHNNTVYAINGHNRVDLANKLGEDKITVRFIKAANAKEARAIGAATNISEGHGTALDAGKFFRDTGLTREQVQAKGITLKGNVASDGLALAQLEPTAFRKVIDGHLSVERATILGGSGLTHAQQKATLDLVDAQSKRKGGAVTNDHLRELIDGAKASPVKTKTLTDLFGTSQEDVSLLLHRSKLISQIKEKLASDKRVFNTVAKGKNAEKLTAGGNVIDTAASAKIGKEAGDALAIFDQLKHRSGPVARALNEGSERIYNGETPSKVLTDVYKRALAGVREELQ